MVSRQAEVDDRKENSYHNSCHNIAVLLIANLALTVKMNEHGGIM